jgi:hypothetical protein
MTKHCRLQLHLPHSCRPGAGVQALRGSWVRVLPSRHRPLLLFPSCTAKRWCSSVQPAAMRMHAQPMVGFGSLQHKLGVIKQVVESWWEMMGSPWSPFPHVTVLHPVKLSDGFPTNESVSLAPANPDRCAPVCAMQVSC